MRQYVIRRVLMLIPVALVLSIIIFSLLRLIPGDLARTMLPIDATDEEVQALRAQLGLTKPLHLAYVEWLGNTLKGEFGDSYFSRKPVIEEIRSRMWVSVELAVLALSIAILLGVPIGVMSAIRQDTVFDYVGRFAAIIGLAIPNFWLGTLLITLPSLWLGYTPPTLFVPFFDDPLHNLEMMWMPALALGAALSAVIMRMTRSQMLEVRREDYIRTAWAKGLRERTVIYRHALKNAMIPVLTIVGLQLSVLIGGTVIIETVFALPGMGRLVVTSIMRRDYVVVQATVLIMSMVFVLGNLIVDLLYGWLDPRIRYR